MTYALTVALLVAATVAAVVGWHVVAVVLFVPAAACYARWYAGLLRA